MRRKALQCLLASAKSGLLMSRPTWRGEGGSGQPVSQSGGGAVLKKNCPTSHGSHHEGGRQDAVLEQGQAEVALRQRRAQLHVSGVCGAHQQTRSAVTRPVCRCQPRPRCRVRHLRHWKKSRLCTGDQYPSCSSRLLPGNTGTAPGRTSVYVDHHVDAGEEQQQAPRAEPARLLCCGVVHGCRVGVHASLTGFVRLAGAVSLARIRPCCCRVRGGQHRESSDHAGCAISMYDAQLPSARPRHVAAPGQARTWSGAGTSFKTKPSCS